MASKKVTINIDDNAWTKFNKKVEEKEGTTYGKLGPTLVDLIENYYLPDDIKTTTEDTEKLIEENDKLKDDLNILNTEYEELKKQNKETIEENNALNSQVKLLKEELEKQNNDNKELLDKNSKLQSTVNTNKNKIHDDYDDIKQENNQLNRQVIELEKNNMDIDKLSQENRLLQKEIEDLKANEERLKIIIKSRDDEITRKDSDTEKVRDDRDKIREELDNKRKEYSQIRNEKNHSDERQRQLQDQVNDLEVKTHNYKNVLKQLDNMSVMDRILGRYPDDIKELKS